MKRSDLHGPSLPSAVLDLALSSSSASQYGTPPPLELGCTIFLSHSGSDKNFVRHLHRELWHRGYDAFYDQDTLPKAVPISMHNILREARSAKLGVLVLSEDFFMRTQNPILELAAFIDSNVQLLPLFYKLNVNELKEQSQRARWEERWREWVADDVITEWNEALATLCRFNGLEFCKEATNELAYIDKVVDEICSILPPAASWCIVDIAKAEGMGRLCQIVSEMYEDAAACPTVDSSGVSKATGSCFKDTLVVAMHGFPGIGKSTLCKALCYFFYLEFKGRVYHIDVGRSESRHPHHKNSDGLFSGAFYPRRVDGACNYAQVQNRLGRHIQSSRHPVFLAIDNVQDHSEDEAMALLNCSHFPRGSKIFITSRSPLILKRLTRHHKFCVVRNFPDLCVDEARNIFLGEAFGWENAKRLLSCMSAEEKSIVDTCVRMCTLNHSEFHPLVLKSWAASLMCESQDLLHWRRPAQVEKFKQVDRINEAFERVFGMLENDYKKLNEEEKTWFIDVHLYHFETSIHDLVNSKSFKIWLQRVHLLDCTEIDDFMSRLRALSLMRTWDALHDLVKDFSKYKTRSLPGYLFFEECEVDAELVLKMQLKMRRLTSGCASRLRNVTLLSCQFQKGYGTLDLLALPGIEVLHLWRNKGLEEVLLSHTTCTLLRSLIVRQNDNIIRVIIVEEEAGLISQKPMFGSDLRWLDVYNCKIRIQRRGSGLPIGDYLGQKCDLPPSDAWLTFSNIASLEMFNVQVFGLENMREFKHLERLDLEELVALKCITLDNCSKLKHLVLSSLPNLKCITLDNCPNLEEVSLFSLPNLKCIRLENCPNLKELSLLWRTVRVCF